MIYLNEKGLINNIYKNIKLKRMYQEIKKDVDSFFTSFHDSTDLVSGWGHNNFCKDDGGLIIFDYKSPYTHICSVCNKDYYNDPLYNSVWVYNYRNLCFLSLYKCALVYQVEKDVKYLNYIINTVSFYANNYESFKRHDKTGKVFEEEEECSWGCGRIMPQSLNESMIIIKLVHTLEIVKESLDDDFLSNIKNFFFPKVFELIYPQVNKIHNISCWILSAIGCMGLFSGNKEMLDACFKNKFNINDQLLHGVTKDGFWFEGSIHYNYFLLEGVISLNLFSRIYDFEFKNENIIYNMLINGFFYAFENLRLPNPNDGWPNINLKTYSHVYAVASKVFGYDSMVCTIYKNIENSKIIRGRLPLSEPYYFEEISLERLSICGDLDTSDYQILHHKSICFPNSYFARLISDNKDVDIFLKYGHNGPSHAHLDKMNIEVMFKGHVLSSDLSNCGYGINICGLWHRMSPSHNTCVIDGESHVSFNSGKMLEFSKDHLKAINEKCYQTEIVKDLNILKESLNDDELIKYIVNNFNKTEEEAILIKNSKTLYNEVVSQNKENQKEVDFIREISLINNGFIDEFSVLMNNQRNVDYFFHTNAIIVSELKMVNSSLGYDKNGYQYISDVQKVIGGDFLSIIWSLGDLNIKSSIELKNKELFIGKTYGNPINETRTSIIIRAYDKNPIFKIKWEMI